jgi:hypothetical protein
VNERLNDTNLVGQSHAPSSADIVTSSQPSQHSRPTESRPTEHVAPEPISREVSLRAPEPQRCCSGGNCAECGKQQPTVESSPELAVFEQQAFTDLDSFFADLTASREAVSKTVGIEGVIKSGDGSVAHVGKTTNTLGTIGPAESSVRYYQAPSPLLTSGLGVTPVAEKLVSIGSIPKQAASEGFHATGSLREMIPGVQESRSAPSTSTFAEKTTNERREAAQSAPREKASPAVERAAAKTSAVQQPHRVREVTKVTTSPTPSRPVEQQVTRPVNYTSPSPSSSRQSGSSFVSSGGSATQTRNVPSSLTSPNSFQSKGVQASRNTTPRPQESRSFTAWLRMPRSSTTSDVGRFSKVSPAHGATSQRTFDRQVRALQRSQSIIRSLDRLTRELITKSLGASGARGAGRISEITKKIASLVKNAEVGGLRSLQQRRALENLRLVARALTTARSPRDDKSIARVMASALRRLNGGVERRLGKVVAGRTSQSRAMTRALTRKALLNARLGVIRKKLERIKVTYRMRSSGERRKLATRSLQARTSTRRNLAKGRVSKSSPSRVTRRSTLRQREGLKQRSRSPRLTSKRKSDQQRQEIKALRREVKALRESLQDIIPMMEMMKTLTKKRRSKRTEEEFDVRGFTSERQLTALLKRKNLSTLERKRIERELAKRRKAKGSAGSLKSVSTSSKKQSGAATAATQESSQEQNKQTDAEMKSYAKSLSTFLMRTDDTPGDEDDEYVAIDQDTLGA